MLIFDGTTEEMNWEYWIYFCCICNFSTSNHKKYYEIFNVRIIDTFKMKVRHFFNDNLCRMIRNAKDFAIVIFLFAEKLIGFVIVENPVSYINKQTNNNSYLHFRSQ